MRSGEVLRARQWATDSLERWRTCQTNDWIVIQVRLPQMRRRCRPTAHDPIQIARLKPTNKVMILSDSQHIQSCKRGFPPQAGKQEGEISGVDTVGHTQPEMATALCRVEWPWARRNLLHRPDSLPCSKQYVVRAGGGL